MTYTLRFPFTLPPGYHFSGTGEQTRVLDGLTLIIEDRPDYYVLKVTGLQSESHCHEYLKTLWSGFNWLLLTKGVPAKATLAFDKVTYAEDPEAAARNLERNMGLKYKGPVHGLVNENVPAAYPSDKTIRFVGVGNPNVIITTPIDIVYDALAEGMRIRGTSPAILDEKLQLAMDLFAAYWTERSDNARLITLVLALESLMIDPPRHPIVVQLLDRWTPDVVDAKARFPTGSDEYLALESLEHELLHKRTDSLRRQVRSIALSAAEYLGRPAPAQMAAQAVWVYDQRSLLVHDGYLPQNTLSSAISTAKSVVEMILEARFRGS